MKKISFDQSLTPQKSLLENKRKILQPLSLGNNSLSSFLVDCQSVNLNRSTTSPMLNSVIKGNTSFFSVYLKENASQVKSLDSKMNSEILNSRRNSDFTPLTNNFKCSCSKTNCLKLYCECFQNGALCGFNCNCKQCYNIQEHKELVQLVQQETKNKYPLSYQKKKKISKNNKKVNVLGCKCKKTKCDKKYCACFTGNMQCSNLCKCLNCENQKVELTKDEQKELKKYQKQNSNHLQEFYYKFLKKNS